MKIKQLVETLNQISPFFLQEKFDNSGVQFANLDEDISKILICLDVTEEILQEAIRMECNVILSHHPLFFHPLKRITKQENPFIYQLIYHHLNLISLHTNFDLAENGLNNYVGQLLNLKKIAILKSSSERTFKLAVYVPEKYQNSLLESLFQAGAGQIGNYSDVSFSIEGKGSFKPLEGTNPFLGKIGKRELTDEIKIEMIFNERNLSKIISTIHQNHPYEEPAYDIYQLESNSSAGIGLIAKLPAKEKMVNFSKKIKSQLRIPYLRIIQANKKEVQTIAMCTGSGGSLIEECLDKQVDLFITGDIDHHEALKAQEMGLNIIDIEHFYTEKFFVPAIRKQLTHFQIPEEWLISSQKMKSPFKLI